MLLALELIALAAALIIGYLIAAGIHNERQDAKRNHTGKNAGGHVADKGHDVNPEDESAPKVPYPDLGWEYE